MLDCRNALSRNYDEAVFDKAVRGMADRFLQGPDELYDFLKTECVTNSFGLTDSERALICGVLRPHPEVAEAKIFGSRAKGNSQPASDIDLALWGNISQNVRNSIAGELDELPLPYTFDVQAYDAINH